MVVFDVLTIFPHLIESYFGDSIIWREIKKKTIGIKFYDIRKYSKDKHKKVDGKPYGGGAGMIMTPQPIFDCVKAAKKKKPKAPVVYLTPHGELLDHKLATKLAAEFKRKGGVILLCGRYEGIDNRLQKLCIDKEISVGNYILTGGELAACVLIDVITRLLPGALGNKESAQEDSFSQTFGGKKEYPHYTRPPKFKGLSVPKVLLSGNHKKIEEWRTNRLS